MDVDNCLHVQSLYLMAAAPGINGCSLKTEENLAVMAQIPRDRLLLETDSPYCDVRPSHAGRLHVKTMLQAKDKKKYDHNMMVKGRNEPCNIVSVFEVVTGKIMRNTHVVHTVVSGIDWQLWTVMPLACAVHCMTAWLCFAQGKMCILS